MTQQSASPQGNPVELWYTRCGAATASALAIRKSWLQAEFARGGTVLHSLRDSDSLEVRNSHYHHGQSGMFREGGNIPPIWAKAGGSDTVVVGITWLDEYQGILVRAGSGINSIADLKGKRLGVPLHRNALIDFQRGAAQHGFATALSLAGLTPEQVSFVHIEVPDHKVRDSAQRANGEHPDVVSRALETGYVDAIFLRFARGYRTAQDPRFHQILNINDLPDPLARVNNGTPRPITVDRAFLDRHPDIVARYLAVLLRTANWAAKNPHDVATLLTADSGGDAADVLASHGSDVHLSFTPKLSAEYIAGLEVQKNFLRDWGYLKADFDVNDWIVREPLAAAHKLVEQQPHATEFSTQLAA
ncbi:ABC transporter substrate-binding protein [Janthinobacterium sp. 17J80-10]|uniref:ABC transporter substrate-binding protein n=1 Tax=Janthinobacterium sp. 17J80-10 TaxID=2497863 RepID=UPI0010057D45|nr:ABC transporter substrate-binding protein [Janthinobacterium sp. 17J80-10]QAU33996.1 ABC transporter substrate-binding protein [Janthinobacterium sp. 17J80-10]